jgi:hypothetical protein
MPSIPCKMCAKKFQRPERGRKPRYCSAACRQRSYRKRLLHPHARALKLIQSDFQAMKDLTARETAAVKALEDLGYAVRLQRVAVVGQRSNRVKRPKRTLRLVPSEER